MAIWQIKIATSTVAGYGVSKVYAIQHPPLVSPLPPIPSPSFNQPSDSPTPQPSTTFRNHVTWNEFKTLAKKLAPLYDYPVNLLIAQAALESDRGQSKYCQERNNCFGIGAYDWDPDQAYTFDNPEQGIIAYMLLVKQNFKEAYQKRYSPVEMLKALKQNSEGLQYASDPQYVQKVMSMPEWSQN